MYSANFITVIHNDICETSHNRIKYTFVKASWNERAHANKTILHGIYTNTKQVFTWEITL